MEVPTSGFPGVKPKFPEADEKLKMEVTTMAESSLYL